LGYDAKWGVVSAENAGASHKRERIWVLAYAKLKLRDRRMCRVSWWDWEPIEALQDAREGRGEKAWLSISESELGRVAHGVAHRVDRLKAIGNGQVPAVVRLAWELLSDDAR